MERMFLHLMFWLVLLSALAMAASTNKHEDKKKCHLSNCIQCTNPSTCARCADGFRKRFVQYGQRTICVMICGPIREEYVDSDGQKACRKRTDTEGCLNEWCIRCYRDYVRVSKKGFFKFFCERNCPPGFTEGHETNLDTRICTK